MKRLEFASALFLALTIWCATASAQATDTTDIAAKAAVCSACHGAAGVPTLVNAPILWGQNDGYIYLELKDYKNKVRANPIMNGIAADMSRDEMFALAKYFSEKPWPNLEQPSASADVAKVALVANGSVGCTGCHLANYQGNSTIPRLAGQKEAYLLDTMQAFRSGARANNPGMTDLMNAAAPDDLKALAAYLAGL